MANWQQYGYSQAGYGYSQPQTQAQQYPMMEDLRPEDFSNQYPAAQQSYAQQSYYATPAQTVQTQANPPFTITQYAKPVAVQGAYNSQPIYYNYQQTSQGRPANVQTQQRHVNQADPRQNRAQQPVQQRQQQPQQRQQQQPQQSHSQPQVSHQIGYSKYGSQQPRQQSSQGGYNLSPRSGAFSSSRQPTSQHSDTRAQSYSSRDQRNQQPSRDRNQSEQRRDVPPPPPPQPQKSQSSSQSHHRGQPQPPGTQSRAPVKPQQTQPTAQQKAKQQPPPQQKSQQPVQKTPTKQDNKKPTDMEISDDESDKEWHKCEVCDIKFQSDKSYRLHCNGLLHTQKVLARGSGTTEQNGTTGEDDSSKDYIEWTKGYFKKGGDPNLKTADKPSAPEAQPSAPKASGGKTQDWFCKVCDKRFLGGPEMWYGHIADKSHCSTLLRLQLELGFAGFQSKYGDVQCKLNIIDGPVDTADEVMNYADVPQNEKEQYREFVFRCGRLNDYHCRMCNVNVMSVDKWVTHIQSKKHFKKFVFYLTKVKETAEEFWEECGTLPGVYPGKIRDCIPTEGLALKDWVKQTFNIQQQSETKSAAPPKSQAQPERFQGTITQLKTHFGVVDDNTQFDLSLTKGWALQLRDRVRGMRIPTPLAHFKYKAVKVEMMFSHETAAAQAKPGPPRLMGPRAGALQGSRPRFPPPRPGDPRAPPPYPRPYPEDPYRRPPAPHDPYYDYYRRPPHPSDPYYRPPYPHDPYYRPPLGADGKPRPPLPTDPYYRPPHPDDPYRRPYPHDPYDRPPHDPYYPAPYPYPDDPYRRPDYPAQTGQVEIPGTGYIDFASAPNPTAKKPDAKIFSMEEMTQIQQLLKEMEDTKDDPFKQLALSAKLRILQEKQAAAMAKTATTQAEALKKLEGVMSEEEMSELKKALYKIQAKKQMNKEGAKDEDRKGDDKRKKGDKMPPWRAPKGSKEGKRAPWADERTKDAPWAQQDSRLKDAPWEKDDPAPWGDDAKPFTRGGRELGVVPDAPWAAKPDPWSKGDDTWENDDDRLWEPDEQGPGGPPPGRGPVPPLMGRGPPAPWSAGGEGGVTLMTPEAEAAIRAARQRRAAGGGSAGPGPGDGAPPSAAAGARPDADAGVTLITPDLEAKIREARKKKLMEATGADDRRSSTSKDAPWDTSEEKGREAPWQEEKDRGTPTGRSPADKRGDAERKRPSASEDAPWDSPPRRRSVSNETPWDSEPRLKVIKGAPWDTDENSGKKDDVTLISLDNEEKIKQARKQGSGAGSADPWSSGGEAPERRASQSEKADPWNRRRETSPASKRSDPWDKERDSRPTPWDAPSAEESVKAPWEEERKTPVVAPWDEERRSRKAPATDAASPWDEPEARKPAADVVAPWEQDTSSPPRVPPKSPPRPPVPTEAPWEKNNPKKKFSSDSPPPWAVVKKEPETFIDLAEAEEFGVSHNDVQAAKLAPWNRAKSGEPEASPPRRAGIVRFGRDRSGSRDGDEEELAPWHQDRGSINKVSDFDFGAEGRPPSPDSPGKNWEVLRGVEDDEPPWTVKSPPAGGKPRVDEDVKDAVKQFLESYEDFHDKGGSHIMYDQLSDQVRDLVAHVQDVTYNDQRDIISTVHLMLALDPGLIQELKKIDPPKIRDLVETSSTLQIQALEILSVSVSHIAELHTSQGSDGRAGAGEKRRADVWGDDELSSEKRPRF